MTYQFWSLSEVGPDNLGPACTDNGLLLGRTSLIERRGGRFVVRNRDEIERLFKRAYGGEPTVDRLITGLATVASALNVNDACLARIAAVHLKIPDLPNKAARDALEAEDSLIKYAQDEGGSANWNPALHPRTGTSPNPGWFAPTDGSHDTSGERVAENQFSSPRIDAAAKTDKEGAKLAPNDSTDQPAQTDPGSKDQPRNDSFWSNVSSAVKGWLQQPIPEYDLDTGQVVGQRPRWQAIAPYVGFSAATAALLGGVAAGFGTVAATAGKVGRIISSIAQEQADLGIGGLSRHLSEKQLEAYLRNPAAGSRFLGTAVHKATAEALKMQYPSRFTYNLIGPDFLDKTTGELIELTTQRQVNAHLARPGYGRVTISTYKLPVSKE
jgi:hypothetical protein